MPESNIPKIDLASCSVKSGLLHRSSRELMNKYAFIPFDFSNEILSIAISTPDNQDILNAIRAATGYEISIAYAPKEAILAALQCAFNEADGYVQNKELQLSDAEAAGLDNAGSSVIVRLVDKIVELAVGSGASDIHIEPQNNALFVRFRVDGVLHTVHMFQKPLQASLIARIKVMSNMDITERRLPQDGQFTATVKEHYIDFRVSTLPGKYGEKVVIRVLDKTSQSLDLAKLGFEPGVQGAFETIIQKAQGMILVTGPTGSGKTTTLYAVLNRLKSPLKNVITLEDPIEYELLAGKGGEAGITQVQVNTKIGMTFTAGLRASLRQDPDIIMVGEIRDKDTAEIAMKAAMTGHLVLSTLHTNDSIGTLVRLKDMGIEPYLISSTVTGILAQRLVRALCPKCKQSYKPPARAIKLLFPGVDESAAKDILLYRSSGCPDCNNSGYLGRIGIFELLVMTDELRAFINSANVFRDIVNAPKPSSYFSLRDGGLALVRRGLTTVEEVFRVTVE